MKELIKKNDAYKAFLSLRRALLKCTDDRYESENFYELLAKTKKDALAGDPIAQDFLSYLYKSGVDYFLHENYTKYIDWSFLAGANGNAFAIEKLQFLFSYAYDTIVEDKDFGLIKYLNNIDEYNYIGIIGQVICDELVKELNLTPELVDKLPDKHEGINSSSFTGVRKSIDAIIPKVIERMKSRD